MSKKLLALVLYWARHVLMFVFNMPYSCQCLILGWYPAIALWWFFFTTFSCKTGVNYFLAISSACLISKVLWGNDLGIFDDCSFWKMSFSDFSGSFKSACGRSVLCQNVISDSSLHTALSRGPYKCFTAPAFIMAGMNLDFLCFTSTL